MSNSVQDFSFQPPFHSMCLEKRALLSSTDPSYFSDWIDFSQLGLLEMPDVLILGNRRFQYAGTSDGRAYYQEQELEIDNLEQERI